MVAPETYVSALGQAGAAALSATILAHLANSSLFTILRQLLVATSTHSLNAVAPKPYIEALVTQLVVRLLGLKGWVPQRSEDDLHALLFVPSLWRLCISLQPVVVRVTRTALAYMAPWAVSGRLAELLPQDGPQGEAGAVAFLVANLMAVGHKLLPTPAADKHAAAPGPGSLAHNTPLNLVKVMNAALELLPLQPFFPAPPGGGSVASGDDSPSPSLAGALASSATNMRARVVRLSLPSDTWLGPAAQHSEVVGQVQGLTDVSGRHLLKHLVAVLLPYTSDSPLAWSPTQPLGPLQASGEAAYCLCRLVATLADLPAQHQRVFLPLAVSAGFVERLWWSFLRPARLADLAGVEWLLPPTPHLLSLTSQLAPASGGGIRATAGGSTVDPHASLPHSHGVVGAAGAVDALCSFGSWGSSSLNTRRISHEGMGVSPDGGSPTSMSIDLERHIGGGGVGSSARAARAGNGFLSRSAPASVSASMLSQRMNACVWQPIDEDPGWMLPLAVLCDTFSAHIMTSDLDEFYINQRPLALDQLYMHSAPDAGLLAMLRDALWQVWSHKFTLI